MQDIAPAPTDGIRLNLGCGSRQIPGFVNVDREAACQPDLQWDLESVPWPFEDDSVSEVRMSHVLEHLGQDTRVFLAIFQELYRVCRAGAVVDVRVPHPRHDTFLADPTHVRPVTLETLSMFSRDRNLEWQAGRCANTPLALYLGVDFEIAHYENRLDPRWQARLDAGEIDEAMAMDAMKSHNNVVEEIAAQLVVVKTDSEDLTRRLLAAGETAKAVQAGLQAVEQDANNPNHWQMLGTAMFQRGQYEGAVLAFRRTTNLDPSRVDAWCDLGLALRHHGNPEEALEVLGRALELDELHTLARVNRAAALGDLGRYGESAAEAGTVVRDHPRQTGYRANYANALRRCRRFDEAIEELQACVRHAPEVASHHWNLAMALFAAGRYGEAFRSSEFRYRRPGMEPPEWVDAMWDGSSNPGQTLLLQTEQGMGDAIQFVRFARLAAQRGMRVVLRCPERLVPLLGTAPGIDDVVPAGTAVEHDHAALIMSLPAILGLELEDVRHDVPYLSADPARGSRFVEGLPEGFLVGVCWQGNPKHDEDRTRSFPLAHLAPLAELPDTHLVSLQHGHGTDQLAAVDFSVHDLGAGLDEEAAFVDTAAVLSRLDLVITCDSAIAHLAGALGKRCFVALPYAPCWRWMPGEEKTPWYPNTRLFTQPEPNVWRPVFEAMAQAIRDDARV
ncbi:MAG: tetratricopeptide repeat protein [Myxococcales bacterium]|nr:tetratricopeptide repeat protein [Myxococcales bacterium]